MDSGLMKTKKLGSQEELKGCSKVQECESAIQKKQIMLQQGIATWNLKTNQFFV